ncbi:hypothetical protein NFI96_006488 [Prochilodus magdalenae]|nr:hypothetical protein NFI96_006488 [Prochilodus magdalenae]
MARPGAGVMVSVGGGLGYPSQSMARVVVWEWLNEHGRWRPYSAAVCHHIENIQKGDARGTVILGQVDPQLAPYVIDLQSMHQFRQDTVMGYSSRTVHHAIESTLSGTGSRGFLERSDGLCGCTFAQHGSNHSAQSISDWPVLNLTHKMTPRCQLGVHLSQNDSPPCVALLDVLDVVAHGRTVRSPAPVFVQPFPHHQHGPCSERGYPSPPSD